MSENTGFEPQLSEMLSPPEVIPFSSLVGLYYKKNILNYYYILNFVNKCDVKVGFLSFYISVYTHTHTHISYMCVLYNILIGP